MADRIPANPDVLSLEGHIRTDKPYAYYTFEDPSAPFKDYSGNNRHGSPSNYSHTQGVALSSFDSSVCTRAAGVVAYLPFTTAQLMGPTGAASIEGWFVPGTGYGPLACPTSGASGNTVSTNSLGLAVGSSKWNGVFAGNSITIDPAYPSAKADEVKNAVHLAITGDLTSATIYLNGSAAATKTVSRPIIPDATNQFCILNPSTTPSYLGFHADDVAFYTYRLTPQQIKAHYDARFVDGSDEPLGGSAPQAAFSGWGIPI